MFIRMCFTKLLVMVRNLTVISTLKSLKLLILLIMILHYQKMNSDQLEMGLDPNNSVMKRLWCVDVHTYKEPQCMFINIKCKKIMCTQFYIKVWFKRV